MMIYVDDIIIANPAVDTHLKSLEIVFSKLREANLKLHPAKCSLMPPELKYLGFIFSKAVTIDYFSSRLVDYFVD